MRIVLTKIGAMALAMLVLQACDQGFSFMTSRIDRLLDKYFDAPAKAYVHCISKETGSDKKCSLPPEKWREYNKKRPSLLLFMWKNRDQIKLTPDDLQQAILDGGDPNKIAMDVIANGEFEYFQAFVKGAGGPNALNDGNWYDGSILHGTIALGSPEKLRWILTTQPNLEQVSPLNKETPILVATISGGGVSEFERINMLLDAGANPRALDSDGRGICDYIENGRSLWDADFPNQRADLRRRLKVEFDMTC
jgi:hypothetical protein